MTDPTTPAGREELRRLSLSDTSRRMLDALDAKDAEIERLQKLVSQFTSSKVHGQAIEEDDHLALDEAGVPRILEGDSEQATCGDRVRWLCRKHQEDNARHEPRRCGGSQ